MSIDFRNVNTIWTSVLVETLARLGLRSAIICPGSRSAPLAIAFAQHPQIEAIPVLDERSASFFALGMGRSGHRPVAIVCSSGTAGANFFMAVIEAHESRVPLLVLTADRPPELRDCNAGQTIDQQKLYGGYPNWYHEVSLPAIDRSLLAYLRQTVIFAWERSQYPIAGAVHLNLPFRDPLAPIEQAAAREFALPENFFDSVASVLPSAPAVQMDWPQVDRGIIVAGVAQPANGEAYCQSIAHLAKHLGYPVLAEGLSPVRNFAALNPYLISTYDLILRQVNFASELAPAVVIRVGEMPTSKILRQWITQTQPRQYVIDWGDLNLDPTHGFTTHLRGSIEALILPEPQPPSEYLWRWCELEGQVRDRLDTCLSEIDWLFEGKTAWMLSQHLPPDTPLFIANSMPVRDVEWFWRPGNLQIRSHFNRGANGIDGTLSTALGMAHCQAPSVLLTGDLAFLHDTNGLLLRRHFVGSLTIVLLNNNGGGIFQNLPIARFDPPFEEFFATPQDVDFAQLCRTYRVEHEAIANWRHLQERLSQLPASGIRVLEVRCDRVRDAAWRRQWLDRIAQF
ncbi:2-succinyl-5-enolpyruvyl-6-hydroxy-3-cyclohexene-1-carboxylic-acid synthase [Microcoleus sp. FACHB-1515]|uniref:2-succinyl-5-enolpyruvyl-6-hydroxy-3- cyclohexene-1-carboxylic-acid synthase n=1 Tax=Cyanophyceae TaxID=3028117 RepID=UPI0016891D5D|nr:2-succinyl-5-enolpyruvyl-6-hydroxy-3-cyclohexene-1-carboxylic-acid synthase [Microcoleus sp. FACHB-1515]MBD2092602.1 2-succinyl-5-enolpyruvyl-6-hydroxy-3-cyclohexene-1-carboxylic-acid synthase [Microcoleus sp. FACHB-1515]